MTKYTTSTLTLILFLVLTAFSPFKEKHIVGKWMIDKEAMKNAHPEREVIQEVRMGMYFHFKKDKSFVLGMHEMRIDGTYLIKEGKVNMAFNKKTQKLEILSLSKKVLVLRGENDKEIFHFKKVKKLN